MSETRNALLAWASSITTLFAAVDTRDVLTVISAVVLPVVFFTIGKTIDVLLQMYLFRVQASACADKPPWPQQTPASEFRVQASACADEPPRPRQTPASDRVEKSQPTQPKG